MAITLNGTTGITTPAITDAGPISVGPQGVTFGDASVQTTAATSPIAPVVTIYSSPSPWTKPATLKAVKVTVIGGGGGGGGGTPTNTTNAGPGGNGGILFGYAQAPAIPGPLTATVGPAGSAGGLNAAGGAGGTSSFGPIFSATGGAGGSSGGAGGGAGSDGGSFTITPAATISSVGFTNPRSSPTQSFGIGGSQGVTPAGVGGAGQGKGSSGGGGGGGPTGAGVGGAGSAGLIIVEEFY